MLCLDGSYRPWIRTAGSSLRPKPWAFPQRVLTDYLLILVLDGREWVSLDGGSRQDLGPGEAYLLPPGRVTDKGCDDWSHPAWVHFDLIHHPRREDMPPAPCHQTSLGRRRSWLQPSPRDVYGCDLPLLVPKILLPRFQREVPRLIASWRSSVPVERLRAQQILGDLLIDLVATVAAPAVDGDAAIIHAEDIARRSLDADFGVAAFADAAGMSPSTFHERYRRLRGTTPLRFLTEARMALARDLLADPRQSIGSIAARVGHPDPTVFGRIFRREHGCTPRDWRQRHATPVS